MSLIKANVHQVGDYTLTNEGGKLVINQGTPDTVLNPVATFGTDGLEVDNKLLSGTSGSSLVGYDSGTVQDVLDGAVSKTDYVELRAYTGRAKRVYVTGLLVTAKPAGIAGVFQYDPTDTTSADNGGTIIVLADGRRFKRDFDGDFHAGWFEVDGKNQTDNTAKITKAIAATTYGGNLVFHPGTFLHTGIQINKSINIIGSGRYATKLKNTSTGDSVTFSPNVERGSFRDIAVFGDGESPYGALAYSGKGFVFADNAVIWTFERVWMRGHGDHFFYADGSGDVNNINIIDCQLEWGKKSAIHFIQNSTANQINAINVEKCNISGFEINGIEVWGQSINIKNNSIQACKNRGIVADGLISAAGLSSLRVINIEGNYFELCNNGYIHLRAVNSPYPRYLIGVNISGNYGDYGKIPGTTVDEAAVALVKVEAPDWYAFDNLQVSSFTYESNNFFSSTFPTTLGAILDGSNVLSFDSKISRTLQGGLTSWAVLHKNLGAARILDNWSNRQVLKGISACVSHTYTQEKSPSVTATTDFVFDVRNAEKGNIIYVGVPVETDSTSYTVSIIKKHRPIGSVAAYSTTTVTNIAGKSGNGLSELVGNSLNGVLTQYDDFYLVVRVSFQSAATYCYIHNPIIGYIN